MELVLTHYDGDGYVSGFLMKKYLEEKGVDVAVGVARFLSFGVAPGLRNIVLDKKVDPGDVDTVYLLDLGTDAGSIRNIYGWLGDTGREVLVIDHHENSVVDGVPGHASVLEEYPGLRIINEPRACTTALVYRYVSRDMPGLFGAEEYRKAVLAGISADMHTPENSDKYPVSAGVYEELMRRTSVPTVHFPGNKSLPEHIYLATLLNTIRRVFVGYAGGVEHVGIRFLEEYVENGILPSWRSPVERAYWTCRAPAMTAVMDAYRHWLDYRSRVLGGEDIAVYKMTYRGLMVAVIDSEYDVGGYYASVWMRRHRDSYAVGREARVVAEMHGYSGDEVYDRLRDLIVGVAIVYNVRLGTVSIRGHIPFEYLGDFARRYFNGGGHRIGAGAGVFSGSAEDFIRYVNTVVRPHVERRIEKALESFGMYIEWMSTLDRSYSDDEIDEIAGVAGE